MNEGIQRTQWWRHDSKLVVKTINMYIVEEIEDGSLDMCAHPLERLCCELCLKKPITEKEYLSSIKTTNLLTEDIGQEIDEENEPNAREILSCILPPPPTKLKRFGRN